MRAIGAGTRIFDLLSREPAIHPTAGVELDPSRKGTIKFENISFEYPSRKGTSILREFDLEVGVGESVALVYAKYFILSPFFTDELYINSGKSGSGKSSVQALLLRYYDPLQGRVLFDGQGIYIIRFFQSTYAHEISDIREFTPNSWRSIIGVVPQVYSLMQLNEFDLISSRIPFSSPEP